MKVSELIDKLQKCPPDKEIYVQVNIYRFYKNYYKNKPNRQYEILRFSEDNSKIFFPIYLWE